MRPLIVGNWKMNPVSRREAEHLFDTVRRGMRGIKNVEVVLCPPFVYLDFLSKKISKDIRLGVQDVFWERQGSFTGEISPVMVRDLNCDYVILGHSERKKYLGESCEVINKKIKAAIGARLKVILCVGEETRESFDKDGKWLGGVDSVLKEQVLECLNGIDEARVSNITIAYEPIWAIGTGRAEDPNDVLSASLLIRKVLGQKYNKKIARQARVLYGGSVTSKNIIDFIKEEGIDGALVGGLSINGSEFARLVRTVNEYSANHS